MSLCKWMTKRDGKKCQMLLRATREEEVMESNDCPHHESVYRRHKEATLWQRERN